MQSPFRKIKRYLEVGLAIFILLAFFVGCITVLACSLELYAHQQAQTWPTKRGIITHSAAYQSTGSQNRKYWRVEITGIYKESREKFNAQRYGYGIEFSVFNQSQAERKAARFPVGAEVDVYHAPNKAHHAILIRDNPSRPTWIAFSLGLFFALLPFLLYIGGRLFGWRAPKETH